MSLDTAFEAANGSAAHYARAYAERQIQLLQALDMASIEAAAQRLESTWRQGGTIFCAGNGGSASTAAHCVTDLAWGHREGVTEPAKVVSVASNVPFMTAVSNDAGYAEVFVQQLRGLFQPGDVLLAISASGNSENILRAMRFAREQGGHTIGLVGFDGGRMKALSTVCVHVQSASGEYEAVEDVHHAVCHMLASFVKRRIVGRVPATAISEPAG